MKFFSHPLCRCLLFCLILSLCCTSCSGLSSGSSGDKYTASWTDLFDTYVSFTVYGIGEDEFNTASSALHDELLLFHRETDIYQTYDGVANLAQLNARPGTFLTVSSRLYDFLEFSREAWDATGGRVNVMLGAVTSLWKECRDTGLLPKDSLLQKAGEHSDIRSLVLDAESSSVMISDPDASIDVGALAKGYAGRLAASLLEDLGVENYLLDLGGNICAHGVPSGSGRDYFLIGIQDASEPTGTYSTTVRLQNACAVTSGDYQRYVEIDGTRYHHIIDPDTLYPCTLHHSVTIVQEDPAICDMLSTALFLMSEEDGKALAETYGADVYYQ